MFLLKNLKKGCTVKIKFKFVENREPQEIIGVCVSKRNRGWNSSISLKRNIVGLKRNDWVIHDFNIFSPFIQEIVPIKK